MPILFSLSAAPTIISLNATPTDPAPPRISWQRSLLLFLAVLLLAVPQAALLPLMDRDEPRFAEAAREMVQDDHFVVPTFNGAPRYDKPPLIYWCQAAAYALFGESAFAARLPSLVATAATAVVIYTWGIRLGREAIGLGAGLSYAFCLQTLQQGRVATGRRVADFLHDADRLCRLDAAAARSPAGVARPCLGVIALGVAGGFFAKGPEAWLPLIPILWYGRGVRGGVLASIVIGLALVLFWALPAYFETHGDYLERAWRAGIADRAWGADQGHGASSLGVYLLELPYYPLLFWLSALPWSLMVLLHLRPLFEGWKADFTDRYLLLNAAVVFVIFTLMATKLPHYTLPAFPLLALFFVRRWIAADLPASMPARLSTAFGLAFTLLAAIAVPIALAYDLTPSPAGSLVREAAAALKPDRIRPGRLQGADDDLGDAPRDARGRRPDPAGRPAALPRPARTARGHPHHRAVEEAARDARSRVDDRPCRRLQRRQGRFVDLTLVAKP